MTTSFQAPSSATPFRFSGHETFPCRYSWLPKAVRSLRENPSLFADEDAAMVRLGVGKNMVRAIRFWAEAAEIAQAPKPDSKIEKESSRTPVQQALLDKAKKGYMANNRTAPGALAVTQFGEAILGPEGHDQFLEDIKTLWLIHWKLSTSAEPLFAWHYLLNFWHRSDFTASEAMAALAKEARRLSKKLSPVTLDHHFTTFLHTYVPTRSRKGEVLEDNLDCPLVELELIEQVGERTMADSNRREAVYAFRVEEKPEISPELFAYCVADFWARQHPDEQTLPFREIAVGIGSPGQVFKLPEQAVRERLDAIRTDSRGALDYRESAALQQVVRLMDSTPESMLASIYHRNQNR
jgi:Protein of unknown function (DUF4007)